jgi:hypothetical protein
MIISGSQTPEHVTWLSDSPETPWPQKTNCTHLTLNLDPVEILRGYTPEVESLHYLIYFNILL